VQSYKTGLKKGRKKKKEIDLLASLFQNQVLPNLKIMKPMVLFCIVYKALKY